ncbi:E3 ubiquitin-protein ligase RNF5 [Nematocida sp. LUAm3]|nr:E3 ubiquitin-protein ligase RNF5 [Nematocida sp. LUAm3]KAI5175680.1 E3 ubiquitin-protein ligase RNF5 [Nematocida sp. LUAm2]KAI5178586.1 E3 ubiquitin-protein ligase RNF5 [Nematocida sp. LUAm1]
MHEQIISRPLKENFDFDCSICLCEVEMPVVTLCGHLFCWSCLCKWGAKSSICPVCKNACSLASVIPIYSKGVIGPTFTENRPPPPKSYTIKSQINVGIPYPESVRLIHMESMDYRRSSSYSRHCLISKVFYGIMLIFCIAVLLFLE